MIVVDSISCVKSVARRLEAGFGLRASGFGLQLSGFGTPHVVGFRGACGMRRETIDFRRLEWVPQGFASAGPFGFAQGRLARRLSPHGLC
jgi:hypothetical protein